MFIFNAQSCDMRSVAIFHNVRMAAVAAQIHPFTWNSNASARPHDVSIVGSSVTEAARADLAIRRVEMSPEK
ncbi:hypothetical protein EYF80_044618 [Liparis tanakae]|uniref:Uncharacterized protein n=1 Tax=Liparis tanakae TaxID=230148 RepID=A0A4Z2FVA8_9TELE|nr:hypothetical protein EYF80_044618 [Liparis tanakae]